MGNCKDLNSYYHCENCSGGAVVVAPKRRERDTFGKCAQCGIIYSAANARLLRQKAVPLGGLVSGNANIATPPVRKSDVSAANAAWAQQAVAGVAPTRSSLPNVATAQLSIAPLQAMVEAPQNIDGCLKALFVFAIVCIALSILISIGSAVSLPAFGVLLVICIVFIFLLRKHQYVNAATLTLFGISAFIVLSSIVSTQAARHAQANQAAYDAHQVQLREQQALDAHEKRLDWNRAHPAEVAKAKADARARVAQAAKVTAQKNARGAEDDRISSIPYATRLDHAKAEFDRLAGDRGLFASAVVLHTYIKDDKFALLIDKAGWDGLSDFEKHIIMSTAKADWTRACSDNFACDPDDIHSHDINRSLGYNFTSYFDGH